jgi:BirA family biotin operon repressor/biotin-[acetyl-CoA-carboxylase] ligase
MTWGEELRSWLPAGEFGQVLYAFDTIDSTNTAAAQLAQAGAAEGTLVVADHQTRGRGRSGTHWETAPGTGVAMSVVLRPSIDHPLRWTGLGALAVVEALRPEGLIAEIKWPNDVLLSGRKVAGILAEAAWDGEDLQFLVLGIGVNVTRGSVPLDGLSLPATCIEEHLGRVVDRARLIAAIVDSLASWNGRLESPAFLAAWEATLAFKGKAVRVDEGPTPLEGRLLGLGPGGEARLLLRDGGEVLCGGAAQSLRPVETGGLTRPPIDIDSDGDDGGKKDVR